MLSSARFIRSLGVACMAAAMALATTACNPNSIGRPCINPNNNLAKDPQISSPALECPSRLCLIQPPGVDSTTSESRNTCTARCESDDDCDAETKDKCARGFACAVAVTVGNFCCEKMCVCRDDLRVGFNVDSDDVTTQQTITPFACDPIANPSSINRCKNVKP